MEEKKGISVCKLFIVLTIAVLLTGITTCLVTIKLVNKDKNQEELKIEKNEKEKEIINENTKIENESNSLLSEEEALKIGKELYEYGYSSYWQKAPAIKGYETTYGDLLEYFTDDFKASVNDVEELDVYSFIHMEKDDKLTDRVNNGGRGSNQNFIKRELKIGKTEENRIEFDSIAYYNPNYISLGFSDGKIIDYEAIDYKMLESKSAIERNIDPTETYTMTYKFEIKKINDTWKISYMVIDN